MLSALQAALIEHKVRGSDVAQRAQTTAGWLTSAGTLAADGLKKLASPDWPFLAGLEAFAAGAEDAAAAAFCLLLFAAI